LPDPVAPTSAQDVPAGILNDTSSSIHWLCVIDASLLFVNSDSILILLLSVLESSITIGFELLKMRLSSSLDVVLNLFVDTSLYLKYTFLNSILGLAMLSIVALGASLIMLSSCIN